MISFFLSSFWQFATPSTYVIEFWPNLIRSMFPVTALVKNVKRCSMTTKFGQKNRWCKFMMMMTFIEVKSHQRVKCDEVYAMRTKFGQKNRWCKLMMMMPSWRSSLIQVHDDDDDFHGGQRSSGVKCGKLLAMVTKLGQKNLWCSMMVMMMTFLEFKGHQRSNVVNYTLWQPYLVKRIADASLKWWWISWRSKVKWSQL